jgi:hypothetical protein
MFLFGLRGPAFVTDASGTFSLAPGVPIVDTAVSTQTLAAGLMIHREQNSSQV